MIAEKIEEMAKRRGFFWKSSEIYGGLSGLYDYGHLGTLLKRKFEKEWRAFFLGLDDNYYEIESCDIMHESVFRASGHAENFTDPVVKCTKCSATERADHILEDRLGEQFEGLSAKELANLIQKHGIKCGRCSGEYKEVYEMNMMFPLTLGQSDVAYLRPETAQGAYVNFRRCWETLRKKMPMGIAIIGKAYRNEISPRNLLLRMREFTQAELQIFFDPETIGKHEGLDREYKLIVLPCGERHNEAKEVQVAKMQTPEFYTYHMCQIQKFYLDILGIPRDKFRFRELSEEERAFYNKFHWDVELKLESGWKEVAGLHYRTDHDLLGHQKISGEDMSVSIEGKKFVPHVLEISFGVDRNVYSLLEMSYREEKERDVLSFPRKVSTFDCAVFPLVKKDGLLEKSQEIHKVLSGEYQCFFDSSGSIGRRYRRMDEIGCALCITVDHQTLEDGTVTLRDRDSMKQVRANEAELREKIEEFLNGKELNELRNEE